MSVPLSKFASDLWGHWLPVLLLWLFCAVWVVALLKHADHKETLSVFGSGVVSTLLLLPFAVRECLVVRESFDVMKRSAGGLLLVAVLSGLERNLTNESIASLGASLKTALHALNVPLTFFIAAAAGVDKQASRCLFGCQCSSRSLAMLPVLMLVTGGALVTAFFSKGKHGESAWSGNLLGFALQLASGVAYASKYTVAKLLLGDAHRTGTSRLDTAFLPDSDPSPPLVADQATGEVETAAPHASVNSSVLRPSKVQIAVISQFMTGVISLAFLPAFATDVGVPQAHIVFYFGLGVTGILIFELRLLELTSPLTVAVLSALHNVAIVLYFMVMDGEDFSWAQQLSFGVSTIGIIAYAILKSQQQEPQEEPPAASARQG